MYDEQDPFTNSDLMAVGLAFLTLVYYGWNADEDTKETLVDQEPLDRNLRYPESDIVNSVTGNVQFDDQDYHLNKSQTTSEMWDANTTPQVDRDYDMPDDELDNADIVANHISGGSQVHIPLEATSNDFHSVRDLTYPKHPGQEFGAATSDTMYAPYRIPLNDRAFSIDDKLARKQHHRADMNKKAIDGAVRTTKANFERFFANELAENESRDWWDAEAKDLETDYKYYQ